MYCTFLLLIVSLPTANFNKITFSSSLSQFTESELAVEKDVKFIGQYTGEGAVTWSVPKQCEQFLLTDTVSQFVCHSHGFHNFSVQIGQETKYYNIHTQKRSECYNWGLTYENKDLKLFVRNQAGERDDDLTLQFYYLGETPKGSINCDKTSIALPKPVFNSPMWTISNVTLCDTCRTNYIFNESLYHNTITSGGTLAGWQLSNMTRDLCQGFQNLTLCNMCHDTTNVTRGCNTCHSVTISSVPSSLLGCTIATSTLPVYRAPSLTPGTTPATTTSTRLCKDYCNSGIGVLLDPVRGVLISHNDFLTSIRYNGSLAIKDCGVVYGGKVLLLAKVDKTEDKLVVVYTDGTAPKEIPLNTTADKITVNTQCRSNVEENLRRSPVIIWSKSSILLYRNGDVLDIKLPDNMTSVETVGINYLAVSFIMTNSTNTMWFEYDPEETSFSQEFELPVTCDEDCKLHCVCPHLYLLESSDSLDFITSNGLAMSPVYDHETLSSVSITIQSVAISSNNVWALLTADKMLYYGYCTKSTIVSIVQNGVNDANHILFDSTSNLYYTNSTGLRTAVPSSLLLKTALNTHTCPVRDFTSSAGRSLIYLDKGETFSYQLQSLTSDFYPSTTILQKFPHYLLSLNTQVSVEPSKSTRGTNHMAQAITVTGKETQGLSIITTSPSSAKPPCPTPFSDVVYVAVGCPKHRQIVVINKDKECNITQGSELHRDLELSGENITYDMAELGCPITWSHGDEFLPEIWIYDNDVPVRRVYSDFVIKEVYGREADYTFSKSVGDVHCNKVPQKYSTMGASWSQHTYRHCFETTGSSEEILSQMEKKDREDVEKEKYEILNATGTNKITFIKRKVAIFVFELTVLGSNSSYCPLSTKFGLWIKNAPSQSDVGIIVLILTCLLMVVILLLSYYHYKRHILAKTKAVLES